MIYQILSLLFTVACFVLFLLCIHYMYDYIKKEFTHTREISMSKSYKNSNAQLASCNTSNSEENTKREENENHIYEKKQNEMILYQSNTLQNRDDIVKSLMEEDIKKEVQHEIQIDDELESYFKSLH